ncbi:MAG: NACHT domain-containing protein [Cyanobacteriota bacterium]
MQRICEELTLPWQEIVEDSSEKTEAQSKAEKQSSSLDIDALVGEVRSHCCGAILDNYSKIRLPDDTRIDVDLLYVDVYVLEKLSSKRYASISGLLEGVEQREDYERLAIGQRQKRLPGQEIVRQFPRLMVLGKPGSGKTTFLRHLAVDCSKGKFFCDRIPVLIELRSIKEGNSFNLLNLIHRKFGLAQQEQTLQILNQGKAFILLDGLDEVASQLRQSVRDQIYEFAKEYRKNRFVLTCRTQTIEYIADHFEPIEVANFDAEQVKMFVRNWFTATPETSGEAEGWTSRFVGKLEENKQIRELVVTPILLTLTCLLFTAEQDLPTKRSELYEKGIDLLLKQWNKFREIPRDYQKLSVSGKRRLLSYLAFRKFEQPDNFILFKQDEIQGYIAEHLGIDVEESEALLEAIEAHHGLLIERAQGIWSFSHLTFQEYFAAKYIVDSPTSETAVQNLVIHITEPYWREVFLLAMEMLLSADYLLRLMKNQSDLLLSRDNPSQQFLCWVNQKSLAVESLCNQVVVRAFYLSRSLNLFFDDSLSKSLEPSFDLCLSSCPNLFVDYCLYRTLYHSYSPNLDQSLYGSGFSHSGSGLPSMTFFSSWSRLLDFELFLSESINHTLKFAPELRQALLELKNRLPVQQEREKYKQWWEANGQAWIEELRTVMIEHRNLKVAQQFSDAQKKLLQQYYDANKLLVDCLNSDCYVSREVRQEIEETLLLPIAEIQKRQQRG